MHIHLLPWEWYEGPGGIPGPHWRPPGGGARGVLDLRSLEQRGTPGGEAGFGLFAFDQERDASGGRYLGTSLDGTLTSRQRMDVAAMLDLGEMPSANLRQFVGHLFTQYADPEGTTARRPVRPAQGKPVRLTFAGQDVFSEPFAGGHVQRALAVFRLDYIRSVAAIPAWLDSRDAARIAKGLQPLTAEQRTLAVALYRRTLRKWTGAVCLQCFGNLDDASVRAVLPDGFKDDGALRPETTVPELWPTTDSTTISSGQSFAWTEVTGNFATDEEEVGGGPGGAHFTFLKLLTSSAYSSARCEEPVSSDDHYTEAPIAYIGAIDDNKLAAVGTRFDAAADTGYFGTIWLPGNGNNARFIPRVGGTNSATTDAASSPDPGISDNANDRRITVRLKSDGSLHTLYRGGVAVSGLTDVTDTAITGNLRMGVLGFDNVTNVVAWQNITITDLTAENAGAVTIAPTVSGSGYTLPPLYPTAPVFKLAGSSQAGTGGVTPAWPTHATNDVALLLVRTEAQASTLTTANGFVQVTNSPQSIGAAGNASAVALQAFWARATSASMASPVLADPGDSIIAQIVTFSNVATSGNPWDITGGGTQGTGSTTATLAAVTTTIPNTLVVPIIAHENDASTSLAQTFTNANLSGLAEITDVSTNSGDGGGFAAAAGVKLTAGNTGDTTVTLASSTDYAFITIALRPQPVHAGTADAAIAPALAGTGTVAAGGFSGTGNVPLALSLSGTGIVGGIGTAAAALAFSLAGTAALSFVGAGSVSLAPTVSGAGLVGNNGSGSVAVAPTISGTGLVGNVGAGDAQLSLSLSGTGVVATVYGQGDAPLSMSLAATGAVVFSGTGDAPLALTLSGSALAGNIGSGAAALAMSLAGTGAHAQAGAGDVPLTLTLAGAGALTFSGSGVTSLELALAGTGTNTANNGITGSGSAEIALSLAGTGALTFTGAGDVPLALTLASSGLVGNIGTGDAPLVLTLAATGNIPTTGSGAAGLALTLAGAGLVGNAGAGDVPLALNLSGAGSQTHSGSGAATLNLALSGLGAVANIVGSGTVSLAPTLAGTGALTFDATGSVALAPTLSGSGALTFAGSGAVALDLTLSSTGSAANPIAGSGSASLMPTLSGVGEVTFVLEIESLVFTPQLTVDLTYAPNLTIDLEYDA